MGLDRGLCQTSDELKETEERVEKIERCHRDLSNDLTLEEERRGDLERGVLSRGMRGLTVVRLEV